MARWEYRVIYLYRGEDTANGLSGFIAELAQAGLDGWEAVGEVTPSYGLSFRPRNIPVLLLKRRVDGS